MPDAGYTTLRRQRKGIRLMNIIRGSLSLFTFISIVDGHPLEGAVKLASFHKNQI